MSEPVVVANVVRIVVVARRVVVVPRVHGAQVHTHCAQGLHDQTRTIHAHARGTRVIPHVWRIAHVTHGGCDYGVHTLVARSVVGGLRLGTVAEDTLPQVRNAHRLVRHLVVRPRVLEPM